MVQQRTKPSHYFLGLTNPDVMVAIAVLRAVVARPSLPNKLPVNGRTFIVQRGSNYSIAAFAQYPSHAKVDIP